MVRILKALMNRLYVEHSVYMELVQEDNCISNSIRKLIDLCTQSNASMHCCCQKIGLIFLDRAVAHFQARSLLGLNY